MGNTKLYQNKLSDTWLKASVLGATWAASEIILGSFLHNLHIPFKGNVLTAIGLILLISASYKWDNKGLFWRSGVICALMKTMSPSAVIFGPMIAIFAEAMLFELSVRLLGKNTIGFVVGAILAMSWVLFQKVFNYLLFYGFNIVKIYDKILEFIEKQLDIQSDIFWLPLIVLLSVYAAFGVVTAILGVRIGRNILKDSNPKKFESAFTEVENQNRIKSEFPHSIVWLILSFIAIIFSLIIISKTSFYFWLPWSIGLVILWVLRYKRGMRQLSKPKFWFSFVIITVLSAMLISSFNGSGSTWVDGLWMGIEMNTRAAIVIIGFSVLGTELYNPAIRKLLTRSVYRQAGVALELAFESLPYVIGNLPDAKTFLTQPSSVVRLLISHAEHRFLILNEKQHAKVFIISGGVADGKSTFLARLVEELKKEHKDIAGFISPRILKGTETVGYQIEDVSTKERFKLFGLKDDKAGDAAKTIGKFIIDSSAQHRAKQLLSEVPDTKTTIFIIDEVGRMELRGDGWCDDVKRIYQRNNSCLILAIRQEFVEDVKEHFAFNNAQVIEVKKAELSIVKQQILSSLKDG